MVMRLLVMMRWRACELCEAQPSVIELHRSTLNCKIYNINILNSLSAYESLKTMTEQSIMRTTHCASTMALRVSREVCLGQLMAAKPASHQARA